MADLTPRASRKAGCGKVFWLVVSKCFKHVWLPEWQRWSDDHVIFLNLMFPSFCSNWWWWWWWWWSPTPTIGQLDCKHKSVLVILVLVWGPCYNTCSSGSCFDLLWVIIWLLWVRGTRADISKDIETSASKRMQMLHVNPGGIMGHLCIEWVCLIHSLVASRFVQPAAAVAGPWQASRTGCGKGCAEKGGVSSPVLTMARRKFHVWFFSLQET